MKLLQELMSKAPDRLTGWVNMVDNNVKAGQKVDVAVDAVVSRHWKDSTYATPEEAKKLLMTTARKMGKPWAKIDEAADDNWPKLLAQAGEFRVEQDEDEQVHILDGKQTVRLSMPLVIWKQLQRQ